MSIKEKIKLYEENIINKKVGYKKPILNTNNVRKKINHWNNINNEEEKIEEKVKEKVIEEKIEKKIEEKIEKKIEKKVLKKTDSEDEYEFENGIINM